MLTTGDENDCTSFAQVFEWHKRFNKGTKYVENDQRPALDDLALQEPKKFLKKSDLRISVQLS